MAQELKAGNVVVLTIGQRNAPLMTVKWVQGSEVGCIWYNPTTHTFQFEKFPIECVVKIGQ